MCLKKIFFPLKWKEFSFKISLSISLRWSVGIGGLFRWNISCVLHTIVIPSSCGMLVYRLATPMDTSIVSFSTFVFSIKFKKSVVSLRYDFCTLAIG